MVVINTAVTVKFELTFDSTIPTTCDLEVTTPIGGVSYVSGYATPAANQRQDPVPSTKTNGYIQWSQTPNSIGLWKFKLVSAGNPAADTRTEYGTIMVNVIQSDTLASTLLK